MAFRMQTNKKQGTKSPKTLKPSFRDRILYGHKEAKRLLILENSHCTNLSMAPLHSPASMVMPMTIWDRLPYDCEIDWSVRWKNFRAKSSRATDKTLHLIDRDIDHLACDAGSRRPSIHPLERASMDQSLQLDLACRLATLLTRDQNEDIDDYLGLARSYGKSFTEMRIGNHPASFIIAFSFVLYFFDEECNREPDWYRPRSWMTRAATIHNMTFMRLYNHGLPTILEEEEEE